MYIASGEDGDSWWKSVAGCNWQFRNDPRSSPASSSLLPGLDQSIQSILQVSMHRHRKLDARVSSTMDDIALEMLKARFASGTAACTMHSSCAHICICTCISETTVTHACNNICTPRAHSSSFNIRVQYGRETHGNT